MNWYLDVLQKKYAQFEGRAHRTEFWMFFLFYILIAFALAIVGMIGHGLQYLYPLYVLAMFVPVLAVSARRLHDIGKSGWMQLVGLIPCVGAIILIIWFVEDSHPDNQYGPNPKGASV